MEIYILRHGTAEPRVRGTAEKNRTLLAEGRREIRAAMALARKLKLDPQVILTSSLKRATETAAIAARAFPEARVQETAALLPDAVPEAIWKELGARKDVERVMLVGHEPHLGHVLAFLLEAAVAVDLKKGGLVRVDTPKKLGPPRGVLKWAVTPRIAKALK